MTVDIRSYDRERDAAGLYESKVAFERGLGENTGGDGKAAAYDGKLTEAYRERWLDWVDRCVADDPRCVTVAVESRTEETVGYAFVLPERMAVNW
ncbi:GNAT family N-acetyltransferase, partial [Halorubrum sp. SD612]